MRVNNSPWKRILGTGKGADRKYTRRVQRAQERAITAGPPVGDRAGSGPGTLLPGSGSAAP